MYYVLSAQIVALGFVGHPSAYIRDPWNWIDFLVVAQHSALEQLLSSS